MYGHHTDIYRHLKEQLAWATDSSYTVYLVWLYSSTVELQWLQYLKLLFLEIPNVTTLSVFQHQVTYKSLDPQ